MIQFDRVEVRQAGEVGEALVVDPSLGQEERFERLHTANVLQAVAGDIGPVNAELLEFREGGDVSKHVVGDPGVAEVEDLEVADVREPTRSASVTPTR